MKSITLCLGLFLISFYSLGQIHINHINDSRMETSIHGFWINCLNPYRFIPKDSNSVLNFKIIGGTFKKRDVNNEINIIPQQRNVKIQVFEKDSLSAEFKLIARKVTNPLLRLTNNRDKDIIKIDKSNIHLLNYKLLAEKVLLKDIESLPTLAITKYEILILRGKDNVLITKSNNIKEVSKNKINSGDKLIFQVYEYQIKFPNNTTELRQEFFFKELIIK